MVTTTSIEGPVTEFLQREYSITPNRKSLEILVNAGFRVFEDPESQLKNAEFIGRRIGYLTQDVASLTAKLFALAFSYEHILKQQNFNLTRDWSTWLGVLNTG